MNLVTIALFALISVALAYPAEEKKVIKILEEKNDSPSPDGEYSYSYETENGIHVKERRKGDGEDNSKYVIGSYSYTAPDGTPISVHYIADEGGYNPVGDNLPVPPPIPEQIQRALEYIVKHRKENKDENENDD